MTIKQRLSVRQILNDENCWDPCSMASQVCEDGAPIRKDCLACQVDEGNTGGCSWESPGAGVTGTYIMSYLTGFRFH